RWYPGVGIYRNVWLDVTGPVHVARWGTYVTTPDVSDAVATVTVKTELRNHSSQPVNAVVRTTVLDASGKEVARSNVPATIPAGESQVGPILIAVNRPQRWDIDHPYLYTLVSQVIEGQKAVDRYVTPFGIRTIGFDKSKGFLLNGRVLKLRGVCLHHDL